ncbi:MAG: hypothetical protein H6557_29255 [Lewinellaceae bacterium]|nr:hypothetical protein [Phaeodactylibacter sp.]MCB9040736.1 hypothetical protein [Lewinellaceae bacterium]
MLIWTQYGEQLSQIIRQCAGIPVSVGIARTKTLAKLAIWALLQWCQEVQKTAQSWINST